MIVLPKFKSDGEGADFWGGFDTAEILKEGQFRDKFSPIVPIRFIMIQIADEEFDAVIGFSRRLGIGFNIIGRKGRNQI